MNSHQRRIGKKKCKLASDELILHRKEIIDFKLFDEFFSITEIVRKKIFDLGALWSYDTALRIGFKANIYPKEVNVQCGVIKGVRKAIPNTEF